MRWLMVLAIMGAALYFWLHREGAHPVRPFTAPNAQPVAAPASAMNRPPPANARERMNQAAKSAKVEVRKFEQTPEGVKILIAWHGDVATLGGDFLQQCVSQGIIRTFDIPEPNQYAINYEGDRRVWLTECLVRF